MVKLRRLLASSQPYPTGDELAAARHSPSPPITSQASAASLSVVLEQERIELARNKMTEGKCPSVRT